MAESSGANALPKPELAGALHPTDGAPSTGPSGTIAQVTPSLAALASEPSCLHVAGYEILHELGRGGMGAVFKGRDLKLGRDLAVKILLETCQNDEVAQHRFQEEAQIGGQLQHPGVVPVYELGRLTDQRPYFTMKLVEGRTLTALLKDRKSPADDLPRFLKIFEQLCQTLAYVHARGVIHRDLKPLNIMVGAFGEVQVMDWGLAKVVKSGGVRTNRSEGPDSETTIGSILGTPAYMAPEQACGDVEGLDERSDVFGLGAMLCEILTGGPPYLSQEKGELLRQAARANLTNAYGRLDGCGADAELIGLAKACLAPEPADRPRNGGAVAEAMASYLAGVQERLRTAEVERAAAQARAKEERKRRRLTVALAATVLLGVAGAGAGALWYQQDQAARATEQARRMADTERDVTAALDEATALESQARKLTDDPTKWEAALGEALSAVKRADGVLNGGVGTEELRGRVDGLRRDLESADKDRRMIARLEEARIHKAEAGKDGFDNAGSAALYAAAFEEDMGLAALAPEEAAERINRRVIREELLAALAEWLDATPDKEEERRLLDLLQAADPDPTSFRNRVNALVRKKDSQGLQQLAFRPETLNQPPTRLQYLGRRLPATEAVKFFRAANERHPSDFWITFQLAHGLHALNTLSAADEAIRYYTAAIALRPASAAVHYNLGNVLGGRGRLDEAIAEYRRSIELKPDFASPHGGLSFALLHKKQLDEALKESRIAVRLSPDDGSLHLVLGFILRDKGQTDEATAEYRKAVKVDPKYPHAYYYLAAALRAWGERDEAILQYRKLIALKPDYLEAHRELGSVLDEQGRLDEAVAEYHKTIELKPDSALAYSNLGFTLRKLGRFSESLAAYRRAHEIGSKDPGWVVPSADWVRAAEEFVRLDAVLPALLKREAEPSSPAVGIQFAQVCAFKGMYEDSVRFFRQSFAADPDLTENLINGNRYEAACAAALGACGMRTDGKNTDDKVRAGLRTQALHWLQANLTLAATKIGTGPKDREAARQLLRRWPMDPALAGVRDKDALAKLPPEERDAWRTFWANVDVLLKKAEAAAP